MEAGTGTLITRGLDDQWYVDELLVQRSTVIEGSMLIKLLAVVRQQNDQAIVVKIEVPQQVQKHAELPVRVLDFAFVERTKVSCVGRVYSKTSRDEALGVIKLRWKIPVLLIRQLAVASLRIIDRVWIRDMDVVEQRLVVTRALEQLLPEKTSHRLRRIFAGESSIEVVVVEASVQAKVASQRPL